VNQDYPDLSTLSTYLEGGSSNINK